MNTEKNTDDYSITKVKWNEISKVGMPPRALRFKEDGLDRTFLVRGEWSIFTAYVYRDGSGFDQGSDDGGDAAVAWAVIDGF